MEEVQTAMAVDPASVGSLIMLNDEINSAVKLHDDIMAGRVRAGGHGGGAGSSGSLHHAQSGRNIGGRGGGLDRNDSNDDDLLGLTPAPQVHMFGKEKKGPPGVSTGSTRRKRGPSQEMASAVPQGVSDGMEEAGEFEGLAGLGGSPPSSGFSGGAGDGDDDDDDPFALEEGSKQVPAPAAARLPATPGLALGIGEPRRARAGSRRSRGGSASRSAGGA